MPQYKLTFRSPERDHVYIQYGKNEKYAKSFVPLRIVGDDFDNPVPLECELKSIEEMEVWAVFQLDPENFHEVKEIAKSQGLHAKDVEGSDCLEVKGKGDWILSAWVKKYKMLSSNWAQGMLP